jgi:hypothetical protein
VTPDLLAVRSWDGAAQRLLLANFGPPVAVSLEREGGGRADGWHVILDTGERRFGGSGSPAQVGDGRMALPERTAVLLAAGAFERGAR